MLKVGIIGSNGFIGRHLTETLLRRGDVKLRLFGRSETSVFGSKIPYQRIDFRNEAEITDNFGEIDFVYHLASETIPATSWNAPLTEIEKNLVPFISFLETLSSLNLKKIAFVSSAGTVYGSTVGKVTEDSNKMPFSPYGITKLAMENFLHYYSVKYKLNYDVYRVSNVYGEGQNTSKGLGIINTFLEKIILEKEVKVFGNGETTRNYIYIADVVNLLLLSLTTPGTSEIYNVASDTTASINNLVTTIKGIVEEDFKIIYEGARQSDNPYIDLDNSKIMGHFSDYRFSTLEQGIGKTYAHLKSQLEKRS